MLTDKFRSMLVVHYLLQQTKEKTVQTNKHVITALPVATIQNRKPNRKKIVTHHLSS